MEKLNRFLKFVDIFERKCKTLILKTSQTLISFLATSRIYLQQSPYIRNQKTKLLTC